MNLAWLPLTAQLGDLTYAGEWAMDGADLHVRCAQGSAVRALMPWDKAVPVAEQILIEILDKAGAL